MNSNEDIQRNKTVTFFPKFIGLEVYSRSGRIVLVQGEIEITIPKAMTQSLIIAIEKAGL